MADEPSILTLPPSPATQVGPAPVLVLVDDDPDFRAILREAVEDLWKEQEITTDPADAAARPLTVWEAANGVEGLRQLRQIRDTVAEGRVLLCIDADMPVMNGLSTLQAISQEPCLAALHRIMLSGSPDPGMGVTARRIGAEAFFAKPFAGEELLRLVEEQLVPRLRALVDPVVPDRREPDPEKSSPAGNWPKPWVNRTSKNQPMPSPRRLDAQAKATTSNPPAEAGINQGHDPEGEEMLPASSDDPQARSTDAEVARGADGVAIASGELRQGHRGVRLLVIEDDLDQQMLIRETLEDHFGPGSVDVAPTCADALARDLPSYDLILCDYNLPDGNGLDLLATLRRRCETPVMMLTGENTSDVAKEAIRRGATDYVVKAGAYLTIMPLTVEKNIAVGRLQSERETATATLRRRATQLEENLREIEQLASTDPLTGCYNRRAFQAIFDQLFAEAYRTGAELSCVMIDLDEFKQVNDSLGHPVGDELIKIAARCIRTNLRQMDVACRYGGDEFVLLLPKASRSEAATVADRIRRDYATASRSLLKSATKTMSIGIATLGLLQHRPASAASLLAVADRVLYDAKQSGRNQTCSAA